jgi:hypothetical protein
MQIINHILSLFNRNRQSIYGARIFEQQSWLDKQVQESQWKRRFLVD